MSVLDGDYLIRPEQSGDEEEIVRLHEEAFGRPEEGMLVNRLRENGNLFLSLVAVAGEQIIGHIAFSPITIRKDEAISEPFSALGLAPVGVLPEYQKKGVGGALIRAGLEECGRCGYPLVILLGHPDYYGRFGFVPATPFGLRHPFGPEVPDAAFMLRFAGDIFPEQARGLVRYGHEFDGLD